MKSTWFDFAHASEQKQEEDFGVPHSEHRRDGILPHISEQKHEFEWVPGASEQKQDESNV